MKKKYLISLLIGVYLLSFYGGYYYSKALFERHDKKESETNNVIHGHEGTNEDIISEDMMLEYKKRLNISKQAKVKINDENSEEIPLKVDLSKLDSTERSWYYIIKKNGEPSEEPQQVKDLIKKYRGYYLGDASNKTIYLTFDEGYENGYTSAILDTLKKNNVKVAFFVTTTYIRDNKELVKRMVKEGHLVCNHSTTHPSMAAIKDEGSFNAELTKCEVAFETLMNSKIAKFFRPPMGNYSELSLYYTNKLGYKTIFWSFAYNDWDSNNQPSIEEAKRVIIERTHGGGIYLLHAVSKTNTEILDWLIKEWKSKGFEFKSLIEI